MGKRVIGILFGLALLLGVNSVMPVYAEDNMDIEQVQVNKPEIIMYLRQETMPKCEDMEVWLDGEQLQIDAINLSGAEGKNTDFFILVDVSNSMPNTYCNAVKVALTNFAASLNEGDKMVLLAFGEEVTTLLDGQETYEERIQAINQLHNNDNKTLLFEAIMKTADMADGFQDDNRKIVLVISDGEDFAVGATTSEEAKTALGERNIPVYAMGIADTAKENLNDFGAFARSLGGTLSVFKASETDITLAELNEQWANTWVVHMTAANNIVDNQKSVLSLKFLSSGITRSKEVILNEYQPDTVSPQILGVEKVNNQSLKVTFSEPVIGADISTAWSISSGDTQLAVTTAVYGEDNDITLTLEEEFYTGSYQISAPGVTDASMEKNPVETSFRVVLAGLDPEEEEVKPAWQLWLEDWWWTLIIIAVLLILFIIARVWRKIKKSKGVVFIEGKASLVDNVEQRQHIAIAKTEGTPITLELIGSTGAEKNKIEAVINGSMIVGRASICDLSLEDEKMSRQHFALELNGENILITDLQTTNGTTVNGVVIYKAHKLNRGDVIAAGSLQMKINW